MTARLVIGESAYVLSQWQAGEWVGLAALPGGAAALIPPPRRADAAGLEAAIEIAEDWLMPHARSIEGEALEVLDKTARLVSGLTTVLRVCGRDWSVQELETMFLRLVDMATGRGPDLAGAQRAFLADMLLLRELAHHARLRRVCVIEWPARDAPAG